MRRSTRRIAVTLGSTALLFGALLATLDPAAVVTREKDRIAAWVSAHLGRELQVDRVDASVFPVLRATLAGTRIAAADRAAAPWIEAGVIEVRFSLWRAIRTLGKELVADEFRVARPTLRAARDLEGRWDFDDVIERLNESKGPEPTGNTGASDLSFLAGARIAKFAIEDARILIDDATLGRPLAVEHLALQVDDVALGQPLVASLKADLVDGSARTPVSLRAKLQQLPKTLTFSPFPDLEAKMDVDGLDLAPWAGLLPRGALAPARGVISLHAAARAGDDLQTLDAELRLTVEELTLRQGGASGRPLSATLALGLDYSAKDARYELQQLALQGPGLKASGSLRASGLSPAQVAHADIALRVERMEDIVALLPNPAAILPPELTLRGPASVTLSGNPQQVEAGVFLDDALVAYADVFAKAPGRALHLSAKGERRGDTLVIPRFELMVDNAYLAGDLTLPTKAGAPFVAHVQTGSILVSTLEGVLPPVKEALSAGRSVQGSISLGVDASDVNGQQQAQAKLSLSGFDAQLDRMRVEGDGVIEASYLPDGEARDIRLNGDLDGLAFETRSETGATVLQKPKGLPLRIATHVNQTPNAAVIHQASLDVGDTHIQATGSARGLDTPSPTLDIDLGNVNVSFDDLRRALPGAHTLPKGGRLSAKLKVEGAPTSLSSVRVQAQDIELAFGTFQAGGTARVQNLEDPVLDVNLPSLQFAFTDVAAFTEALPKEGRFQGSLTLTGDTARLSSMKADLRFAELRVGKDRLKGVMHVEDLDRPRFTFDVASDQLDLDALLEAFDDDEREPSSAKDAAPPTDENPHGLAASTRKRLSGISGQGAVYVAKARYRGVPVERFTGKLIMTRGVVRFDALDFSLYGGTVSGAGTTLDLPAPKTGYTLALQVNGLNLGQALSAHTEVGSAFSGMTSQRLSLQGRGLTFVDLVQTLEGPATLEARALTLSTLDLLSPIVAPVDEALRASPLKGLTVPSTRRNTALEDVNAALRFGGGKLSLTKPVRAQTSFGEVEFRGNAGLDAALDLQAKVELSPATLATWTKGAVQLKKSVAVPLQIGGTWARPEVRAIDVKPLVAALLGAPAQALAEAGEALLRDGAAKLADEAQKAQQAAQAEADRARREIEARAQAEAERARRAAEAAAGEARQQAAVAAENARRQAEAEAKKAEELARQKAAEAARKAEAEAKKQADAAKKRAEEEARRQADAAKKKAEEEAKKLFGF